MKDYFEGQLVALDDNIAAQLKAVVDELSVKQEQLTEVTESLLLNGVEVDKERACVSVNGHDETMFMVYNESVDNPIEGTKTITIDEGAKIIVLAAMGKAMNDAVIPIIEQLHPGLSQWTWNYNHVDQIITVKSRKSSPDFAAMLGLGGRRG